LESLLFRVKLTNVNIAIASSTAQSPTKSCLAFARALSTGDLDRAAAGFARDGCLITADATAIHGRERIRPVLAQMVLRSTRIQIELSSTVAAGEAVLTNQRWRISSGEPDGRRFEQVADALLVLRRIEDEWKLSIAAPWGYRQSFP
jgi:ketosteroid isomerase-like protein